MDNIILIGMPGSGKSTIGVLLAKVLGYQFLDSDLLIQKEQGQLLHEIMEEKGIEGFLEIENNVNQNIDVQRCVIATGGSVVYGQEAMEHLKRIGVVIYLKLPLQQLQQRLGNLKCRGVVLRKGQTLKELYQERAPLYEKYAHITVDETGLSAEETLEAVVKKWHDT